MTEPEGADRIELVVAMNRVIDKLDTITRPVTHQNVTLSGGSFGVWVAAFAAAVCFLMFFVVLALFVNHDRKIDDLNSYVQAIYQQAPHLKPEEEKAN